MGAGSQWRCILSSCTGTYPHGGAYRQVTHGDVTLTPQNRRFRNYYTRTSLGVNIRTNKYPYLFENGPYIPAQSGIYVPGGHHYSYVHTCVELSVLCFCAVVEEKALGSWRYICEHHLVGCPVKKHFWSYLFAPLFVLFCGGNSLLSVVL